ncbi:MAG: transcriptional repressor, partial [Anaerolineaceae bacterium]|nr:transcriptional repressor [Anaerolineaceae bacterium]
MELLSNAKKPEQNINRRRTPQREAICKYISESQSHPSADEIYQALKPQFPSLSLATVYNTLQFLAEEGKINILGH